MSFSLSMVSVIIIADHAYKYLPGTINSVRQQIFSNFEILIFDHGKSRHLQQWIDRQSDDRLRLFSQEDLSMPQMFNWGIRETKGQYIAFLKGGDMWHPHKLHKQVFYLNRDPDIGLVHTWLMSVDNCRSLKGKIRQHQLAGWVKPEILQRNQIDYQSVIVRRSCFDKVGLFDPLLKTNADWDMWIRLSSHYQFMTIAEPLVYYRQDRDPIPESWLISETDLQAVIEKAYQDVPKELKVLKNHSYAYSSLSLAQQVLQDQQPDYSVAHNYCRQALEQSLKVGLSPEFVRVALRVVVLEWVNSGDRHSYLLTWLQTSQTWLQNLFQKSKSFTQLLSNWMLEEEGLANKEKSRILRNEK